MAQKHLEALKKEKETWLVLEDLISGLTSKHFTMDIMRPQPTYSHETARDIIENLTQSSAMRLDNVSMDKLWDLITMVFKWQISMSSDVVQITLRHLYEIETYVASEETQLQLHKMQNTVENFNNLLTADEKKVLHDEIHYWCKDFNVRVSLLLRMGLQDHQGHFIVNNLNPIATKMLKNIGENIYQVTQNGRILENKNNDVNNTSQKGMDNEIKNGNIEENSSSSLQQEQDNLGNIIESRLSRFDSIDVNIDNRTELQDYMHELKIEDENSDNTSFKDELLNMIGKYDNQSAV